MPHPPPPPLKPQTRVHWSLGQYPSRLNEGLPFFASLLQSTGGQVHTDPRDHQGGLQLEPLPGLDDLNEGLELLPVLFLLVDVEDNDNECPGDTSHMDEPNCSCSARCKPWLNEDGSSLVELTTGTSSARAGLGVPTPS